jgi:hypothetical protein
VAHFSRMRKNARILAPVLSRTKRHVAQVIIGILASFGEDEKVRRHMGEVLERHEERIVNGLFYQGIYTIEFDADPEAPTDEPYLGQFVFVNVRGTIPTIRVGAIPKQNGVLLDGGLKKDFPYKPEGR